MGLREILKKPETLVGVAALALVAGLAKCPDNVNTRSPIPSVSGKLQNRRIAVRSAVDEVLKDTGEEEFFLEIPEGFPEMETWERLQGRITLSDIVSRCVEDNSANYCVSNLMYGSSYCYPENGNGFPIKLIDEGYFNKDRVTMVLGAQRQTYEVNTKDEDGLKEGIETACGDAIALLDSEPDEDELCEGWQAFPGERSCLEYKEDWSVYAKWGEDILDVNADFVAGAEEMGYAVTPLWGNRFQVSRGEEEYTVERSVSVSEQDDLPEAMDFVIDYPKERAFVISNGGPEWVLDHLAHPWFQE
ncbi:hypothetical protein HY463_00735 [Candidatus Peregrinibacteria bacterium]|nr:hypothetical protein [Candidatus Peregrinibacteria bacterium]